MESLFQNFPIKNSSGHMVSLVNSSKHVKCNTNLIQSLSDIEIKKKNFPIQFMRLNIYIKISKVIRRKYIGKFF